MSNYCPDRFDDLCAYVAGELTGESARHLEEHLSECPDCRGFLVKLRADHQLLTRFSETLEPTFTRIEKNVMGSLKTPSYHWNWRKIMKTKWTKLAATATVVIIGVVGFIALFTQGKSVAFADVVRPILTARTATFRTTVNIEGVPSQTFEGMFMEPAQIRQTMPGGVMIGDWEKGKMLTLVPALKIAVVAKMKNYSQADKDLSNSNMFLNIRTLIRKTETDDGKSVKFLGEKMIDGKRAIGYNISEPFENTTVWADAETLLPIRIECTLASLKGMGLKGTFVMSDIAFDVDLNESLFSLDVPEGYSVQTVQTDASKPREEDLIEAFRLWADAGAGKLPSDLNISQAMAELMKIVMEKKAPLRVDRNQQAPEQQKQQMLEFVGVYGEIWPKIARGLGFVHQLPADSDWYYAGKDAALGDADTPIFWYRPEGSKTYRVIYGDLSVRDSSVDQLPHTAAGQEEK